MNTITISSSEELKGLVTVFLSNGHQVSFPTERLTEFVEENHMNCQTVGSGLTCDPNSTEQEVPFCGADQYVDENWDSVVANYYSNVILKG